MNRSIKNSSILLSKVAKATLLALPTVLLSVNAANAATFPTFEAGEKYLNHVNYSTEPGKNLIVNPTFDVCGDNISTDIYVMTNLPTDTVASGCTTFRYWGWTGILKIAGGTYAPTTAEIYSQPTEADNLSGNLSNKKTFKLNRKIEVTDAEVIYVSFEYRLKKANFLPDVFQVQLDGSKITTANYDIAIKNKTGFQENFFVIELGESYTGTVDLYWDSNPSAGADRIDHIFLTTDKILNPPVSAPDTDGDGVNDNLDAFPNDAAASVDSDGDGYPDSWNDGKSAADSTSDPVLVLDVFPDDAAEWADSDLDGVGDNSDVFPNDAAETVDTDSDGIGDNADDDDDNDTFTDDEEIAAGTDPLNANIHPADTDGDGWINANDRGLVVNDLYPNLSQVHQPLINILTNYGADAENVNVVAVDTGSANTDWEIVSTANQDNVVNSVVETTGRDGNPTKAFKLATVTVDDAKLIHLQSPTITAVNQNANVIRVAGWVKITGPETFWQRNSALRMLMVNDGGTQNKAKSWTFKLDNPSLDIYNQDPDGVNKGWRYFEQSFAITDLQSTQVKLWLRSDEIAEAFFDDLEVNLIHSGDSDGDLILDSVDNDDDNDGIVDGLDPTPLGDDTLDSDGDGILDAYDNDKDNDGIANALDAMPLDTDNDGEDNDVDTDIDGDGFDNDVDDYPYDSSQNFNAVPVVTAPSSIVVAATNNATSISDFLAGATATDAEDGSLAVTHDAPDTFPVGSTLVTFSAIDSFGKTGTAEATVTIDVSAPVITLNGNSAISIIEGDEYIELGASAVDNIDGDVTANVVISGTIDTATPDTYIIRYNVSDTVGNTAMEVTRTITVGGKDTDGDGVIDVLDAFPNDPSESVDSDGDGVGDNSDVFPNDPTETLDSDGDGVGDNADVYPNDASESMDSDGDGVGDNADAFPNDDSETLDSDGDGVGDNADVYPNDASETLDSDGDGVGDNADVFPNDASETLDSDGDGVGDNADVYPNDASESMDSDGDGVGDNADVFPNDASESVDSDGDGVGDNADAFPNDDSESVDTDGDGIGDNSDPDIDNDGVLNENDADDYNAVTRENDLDRDGISDDVDEDGVDVLDAISAIETAMLALPNGVLALDATAIETDITATVNNFVIQVLADASVNGVVVNTISGDALRRSGSHDLTVALLNTVASTVSFDAVIAITPNVTIPQTVSVRADTEIAFNLDLSGAPLLYPVTFAYRLETIEEVPLILDEDVISIDEGETIAVVLPGQMDGDYQVIFSEGVDRNAAIMGNSVTTIYAEANIAPAFDVALMNNGEVVTLLDETATDASIAITISDIDGLTAHNVAVSINGAEVFNGSNDVTNPVEVIAIDAAALGEGEYELVVVVTELATDDVFSSTQTSTLSILAELPVLEDTVEIELDDGTIVVVIVDTDGDGISDAEEGFGDTDGDGIADYLDNSDVANAQTVTIVNVDEEENETTTLTSVTVDDGLTIVVGDTLKALEAGLSDDIGVAVTADNFIQVLQIAVENEDAVGESLFDIQAFLTPMIDFKIKGAEAGATVNMIIKLPTALPLKAEYRKIQADGTLIAFDIENGDSVMSAMSDAQGDCPAADSETWQAGLVEGNDCVKLAIVDGGTNDDDGTVNGVIVDPALIFEVNSAPVIQLIEMPVLVNEETPVSFVATVTDADGIYLEGEVESGDALTYSWTQTQGAIASLTDADTTTLTATPTAADGEDLIFMLTVSDDHGGTTTQSVTVAVNDIGPTVSASVSASAVNGGDEVTLTANVSDHNADNIAYLWVQTSGEAVELMGAETSVATFTAPNTDTTVTFELMVSDYVNLPKKRTVSVDVTAVEEQKKSSGGTFGSSALLLLSGLIGLRRKVNRK